MRITGVKSTMYVGKNQSKCDKNIENIVQTVDKNEHYDEYESKINTINYNYLTSITLANLKKEYKDINFCIGDLDNEQQIKQYAQTVNSNNIVMSHDFLERMGNSYEEYAKCKKYLENTAFQVYNNSKNKKTKSSCAFIGENCIIYWNVFDMQEKNKKNKKGFTQSYIKNDNSSTAANEPIISYQKSKNQELNTFKSKLKAMNIKSILNSPSLVYTKLAHANSIADVKNVIALSYCSSFKLKVASRSCESKNKIEINAAIKQLGKAITRAYKKINELNKEDSIKRERKNAIRRNQLRKAKIKKAELEKRRILRKIKEQAQIDEGNKWYYYPQATLNRESDSDKYDKYQEIVLNNYIDITTSQVGLQETHNSSIPTISTSFSSTAQIPSGVVAIGPKIDIS